MLIFHGDDYLASRQTLNTHLDQLANSGYEVNRLEAKDITPSDLTQLLDNTNLFGNKPTPVIFGFFSLLASSNKKKLQEILVKNQKEEVILYEGKTLSATQLKVFPQATTKLFKPKSIIFNFLDSLKPNLNPQSIIMFKEIEKNEEVELIFALLIRQVRLLIQATEPESLKLPPWQKNKLISQAKMFGIQKLLKLHKDLYLIDRNIKTGRTNLSLSTLIFDLINTL